MKRSLLILTVLAVCCGLAPARLQAGALSYIPIHLSAFVAEGTGVPKLLYVNKSNLEIKTFQTAVAGSTPLQLPTQGDICNPAPSVSDTQAHLHMEEATLQGKTAIDLGIPIFSSSLNKDDMIYLRSYESSTTCRSADNQHNLIYGQSIRVYVRVSNTKTSAGLSLPIIAAKTTLSQSSSQVCVDIYGLRNPAMTSLAASINASILNVETYAKIMNNINKLVALADDSHTIKKSVCLGVKL